MRVTIPQKLYKITKRLQTLEEVEQYFPGFLAFVDCTEQQIPRPINKNKRKIFYSGKKKRHTVVKTQLMVNNKVLSFIKQDIRKGENMTMISIKRITLLLQKSC